MDYYRGRGVFEKSLTYGQQILNDDPLREEIHREMMRIYLKSGQRALAMRQYEICTKVLADELGIPPMEETQSLYAELAQVANHKRPVAAVNEPSSMPQMLKQLRLTLQGLEVVRERLQQLIQLTEQQTKDAD